MAEAQTNGLKRPHPGDYLSNGDNPSKKIRTPNGSPAPQISVKPDASKLIADARARAEAVRLRLQGIKGGNGSSPGTQSPAGATPPATNRAPMSRLEEMRARVAALTGKNVGQTQQKSAQTAPSYQPPVFDDSARNRGGLSAALHPALLEANATSVSKGAKAAPNQRGQSTSNQATRPGKGKKQLDLSGPSLEEIRQNPYVDASIATTMRSRNPKQLKFLEKGKYIAQAAALRRQHQLEEMKKRIAAQSRKVGINEDPSEKNFLVEAPPAVEWWDEGLLVNVADGYNSPLKLEASDSPITLLEVHPIAIAKPANPVELKPMYLTSEEQAKLRRQRRMADLKEHQMKVRLGMLPPDPPKVKRANMMRVLGEEAVKDPTAVEARVNREIAERVQKHLDMNESRKLSKEDKHEKLDAKKAADMQKGVTLTVYKIDSLANGRNFFKLQKNMEQIGGLGLILSSPKFSLVLCEAGQRGTQLYKKLILNRIDWTENAPSLPRNDDKKDNKDKSGSAQKPSFLLAENPETGLLKDLSGNKARLIFEGEEKTAQFRKVVTRNVETDKEAMEILDRTRMSTFWTLARGTVD